MLWMNDMFIESIFFSVIVIKNPSLLFFFMTSLIGIKANYGEDAIVIAADTQVSSYEGDVVVSKEDKSKVEIFDNCVFAISGEFPDGFNSELSKFYKFLRGDKRTGSNPEKVKKMIEDVIRTRRFMRIDDINSRLNLEKRISWEEDAVDYLNTFIFASNIPNLDLWEVDIYGNLIHPSRFKSREFPYIILGSGSNHMKDFIKRNISEGSYHPDKIDIETAMEIAVGCVECAKKTDSHSGLSYDLVILLRNEIIDEGKEIREDINRAARESLERRKAKYRGN